MSSETQDFFDRTRSAFLWTRLLNIPFWAIFNTLAIILYKDLHATPLQIAAIVALKPMASLFSPYWSALINKRQDRLVSNLVLANILKFFPFLFFPWIQNVWLFVFSFGFFMVFARGVIPAWMEIIKLNIQGSSREKVFAFGSLLDYLGGAILPLCFGWILDDYNQSWRWIFFGTALVGIFSTLFLFRIPVPSQIDRPLTLAPSLPLFQWIAKPWKDSWDLLRERVDFRHFQVGFMLGGAALMMIHTILPKFYVDSLHLSYTEIVLAITVCKGIGFALANSFWVKAFDRLDIFWFCGIVTLVAAVFPLMLLAATQQIVWLYLAYIVYGIMQSGSELGWHMSGPIFAREEESSVYSATNVLMVGLRGCVAPLVGTLIYSYTNSVTVMLLCCFICLMATMSLRFYSVKYAQRTTVV